jgi:hypothetical protein
VSFNLIALGTALGPPHFLRAGMLVAVSVRSSGHWKGLRWIKVRENVESINRRGLSAKAEAVCAER